MDLEFSDFLPPPLFNPDILHLPRNNRSFYRSQHGREVAPEQINEASKAYEHLINSYIHDNALHQRYSYLFRSVFGFIQNSSVNYLLTQISNTKWSDIDNPLFLHFCYPSHIYYRKLLVPVVETFDLFELKTQIHNIKSRLIELSPMMKPYAMHFLSLLQNTHSNLAQKVFTTVSILRAYLDDLYFVGHRGNIVYLSHTSEDSDAFEFYIPNNWIPDFIDTQSFVSEFINFDILENRIELMDQPVVHLGFERNTETNELGGVTRSRTYYNLIDFSPIYNRFSVPISDSENWDED